MDFVQSGVTCFCASIDVSNIAQLADTVILLPEYTLAGSAFTLPPLDELFWHCCFAHFHHASLRRLITEGVVSDLQFDSNTPANLTCEPCLFGKLNTTLLPSSSSRADKPSS
jgi:hypothetical protein